MAQCKAQMMHAQPNEKVFVLSNYFLSTHYIFFRIFFLTDVHC